MKTKTKTKALLAAALLAAGVLTGGGASPATAADDVGGKSADRISSEAEYLLSVGGEAVTLKEGQSQTFAMVAVSAPAPAPGTVTPMVTYPGPCGTLTVTASNGVYSWGINMTCPATSFSGGFSITDLTSGFGGGTVGVLGFSGSASTSKLHGHRYSGTLTGTAYLLTAPVANVVPNATLYTYP